MSNGKLQDARNRLAWTLHPNGGEPGHTGPCCGPCEAEYEYDTGVCMDGYCCHRDTRTRPRPTGDTVHGLKVQYLSVDGHTSTAYLEAGTSDLAAGTDRYTDDPVRVRWDDGADEWIETVQAPLS